MNPVRFDRVCRDQLHGTFIEAFSDYAVDTSSVTEEMKRIRATKNNVDWELSVGAFDDRRMVGFTLIAVDDWEDEVAAYDAATGIVPAYRGLGIARKMLDHALPELRRRETGRFVLEVLQSNTAAVRAYRKAGFEITREFACFELDPAACATGEPGPGDCTIREATRDELIALADQFDWRPSWENGTGAIAYTPSLNWIISLVVRRSARRQGVGSALVRALASRLAGTLETVRLLNVDRGDRAMLAFLDCQGFRHVVDQFEMARPL